MASTDDTTGFDAWLVDKLDALGLDAEVGFVSVTLQDSNFRTRFRRRCRTPFSTAHNAEMPDAVRLIFMMMHLLLAIFSGSECVCGLKG